MQCMLSPNWMIILSQTITRPITYRHKYCDTRRSPDPATTIGRNRSMVISSSRRSRPLERRLRLLQSVLTQIPEAAARSSNAAKRYDREFWTDFLTPCVAMELAQWRFDLLHDAHNDLVEDVLKSLDEVVQVIESDIPKECKAMKFPRLETIAKKIIDENESGEVWVKLAKPSDAEGFIGLLNSLAAVMKDGRDKSQPPSDIAMVSSKPKPLLAPLILKLFSTLSTKWQCSHAGKNSHQAALALSTNRACSVDDNTSTSFTVLLSKSESLKPMRRWQETSITIGESLPKPTVRFDLPRLTSEKGVLVRDLCGLIGQQGTVRVNLNVDGKSLFSHGKADGRMMEFKECEPINFSEAFLKNSSELNFPGKICVAVVLSFSFLDFCGKPWFPGGWKKGNLYLMQNRKNLSLQPFLITDIQPKKKGPSTETTVGILEAKLLDHGVLLMEIFQQDTFQPPPKKPGKAPISLRDKAKEWFQSINWDVWENWARAVAACINGTLISSLNLSSSLTTQDAAGSLGSQLPTLVESLDEIFAKLFHEMILAPLEADFASQWPNRDADQVISELKLPGISKSLISSTSRQAGRSNVCFNLPVNIPKPPSVSKTLNHPIIRSTGRLNVRLAPELPAVSKNIGSCTNRLAGYPRVSVVLPIGGIALIMLPGSKFQDWDTVCYGSSYQQSRPKPLKSTSYSHLGRFFDTSDSSNHADIESAREWLKHFDAIFHKLPKRQAGDNRMIRIGVLDTGINMENEWILSRKHRIRCWPPEKNHHDINGHGTHVAYLLLRLTKHADLRICKVSTSTYIKDADIKQIADAINHFSQPGQDHVDILNLSFGFPEYHTSLDPIHKAIRNAGNNGIIIFAAAGNEGGNADVCWPASLHETGDVIRINSSDGMGSPSSFNPAPEIGRWIFTLGLGVPSCQLDEETVICRSGSSFATPIAAAIAAIILGVMDRVEVSEYSEDLKDLRPRLRTRLGMEKVLCQTCAKPMESMMSRYYYLTPWRFFKNGEKAQVQAILGILTSVSP